MGGLKWGMETPPQLLSPECPWASVKPQYVANCLSNSIMLPSIGCQFGQTHHFYLAVAAAAESRSFVTGRHAAGPGEAPLSIGARSFSTLHV